MTTERRADGIYVDGDWFTADNIGWTSGDYHRRADELRTEACAVRSVAYLKEREERRSITESIRRGEQQVADGTSTDLDDIAGDTQ